MSRPLRICHVATHEGVYRGGAVQLCRMARGQVARGHAVTVIVNDPRGRDPDKRAQDHAAWLELKSDGIRVRFHDYAGLRASFLRFAADLLLYRFDIVHAHRDDALVYCERALRHFKRPALVAQRGTISRPDRRIRKTFSKPRVGAVVAVSEAVRQAINEDVPATTPKTCVIYGSVDLDHFAPRPPRRDLLDRLGIAPGTPVIGSLSAYRKAKGFDDLMPALADVFARDPRPHAVFLGLKVPLKVAPIAEQLGIADRCHFLGHQPDVPEWLSIMDLSVVAATDREGLSGVLRESLAAGVPVISTDCAGNREIVRDRETGLLVPPKNAAALAEGMRYALAHPDDMRAMADRGRRWVLANCSFETQTEKLESLYRALAEGRPLPLNGAAPASSSPDRPAPASAEPLTAPRG